MELRHLRYFVTVAEELHFSRAAARLHIAQPPLSQQIRQLEQELGVELFSRTRRRVRLTDAGALILKQARRTLMEAARVSVLARRTAGGAAGTLRLGFSSSAPYTTLPAILRAFRTRFPEVKLTLFERSSEEQMTLLANGEMDLGFIRLPLDDLATRLAVKTILREPLVAALPYDHRLAVRPTVAMRALANEPFIMFPRHAASGLYDQILTACRKAGFKPAVAQEAVQMQTIVGLVSAGLGVAIVPASLRNLQRARVVYRDLHPASVTAEMAVAYDRDNESSVLRSFLAVLARSVRA